MLSSIFKKQFCVDISTKSPKDTKGIVNKVTIIKKKNLKVISIFITEKREIQIGDKMAGRHGNKGIVSKILTRDKMPYLQDGTPIDTLYRDWETDLPGYHDWETIGRAHV